MTADTIRRRETRRPRPSTAKPQTSTSWTTHGSPAVDEDPVVLLRSSAAWQHADTTADRFQPLSHGVLPRTVCGMRNESYVLSTHANRARTSPLGRRSTSTLLTQESLCCRPTRTWRTESTRTRRLPPL